MRTVLLVVRPNHKIHVINEYSVRAPQKPMHSGFVDEERNIQNAYYNSLELFNKKVENALECNQRIAKEFLDLQHPDWEKSTKPVEYYQVKNILIEELVGKKRRPFKVGYQVKCANASPLQGNSVAPPLTEGELYIVKQIEIDSEGNQHLDVGLVSKYNFITSYETEERLPQGDKIHWCHPIRFDIEYAPASTSVPGSADDELELS